MNFEKWIDLQIDKELARNPELKKVFSDHPERRELYKQKIIDSDAGNDGLHLRYREEMKK